jgi:hypothetical protein
LTQHDLAVLKAKKTGQPLPKPSPAKDDFKGKRYMILTADDSNGRVHFPLPLASIEEPDITTMRRTLQRL